MAGLLLASLVEDDALVSREGLRHSFGSWIDGSQVFPLGDGALQALYWSTDERYLLQQKILFVFRIRLLGRFGKCSVLTDGNSGTYLLEYQ